MNRAIAWIHAQRWAMPTGNLQQLLAIASRTSEQEIGALLANPGRSVQGARYLTMRGSTAVLEVTGPIFRRANLFTEISGATSHEILAQEFATAVNAPAVRAIVLAVDSPGGTVSGTSEFAQMVYAARGRKPIVAHAAMAASAAYWIAAAADRIVISDTGMAGSIGVVTSVMASQDPDIVEIVSSQSPGKRPDVHSEAGRAQIQAQTDELAQVFVDAVAQYRGVSAATVLSDFGQGAMLVGRGAVAAGMADQVGTLEDLLASLGTAAPTANDADRYAAQWQGSPALRKEFSSAAEFVAYSRAVDAGQVTIRGSRD